MLEFITSEEINSRIGGRSDAAKAVGSQQQADAVQDAGRSVLSGEPAMWDTWRWNRTVMWMGLRVAGGLVGVCLALQRASLARAGVLATGTGVQTQPVSQMVTTLTALTVDGAATRLPVLATHVSNQRHADVTTAIIVIHGALRNAKAPSPPCSRRWPWLGGWSPGGDCGATISERSGCCPLSHPLDVPSGAWTGWKEGDLSRFVVMIRQDRRVSSFAALDTLLQEC